MAESDAFNFDGQTARRLLAMLARDEARHDFVFWKPPVPGARISGTMVRWGKLDGILAAGGSQTVKLWQTTGGGWEGWDEYSGQDWEDCYAPPTQAGTIPTNVFVLVRVINGRRIVVGTQKTVITDAMTDFQVDTGALKLQKKTQAIAVEVTAAESGWTDIHTGTDCS